MSSFAAKYYRDCSPLAIYGSLYPNDAKRKIKKTTTKKENKPKVSDLVVYGNLSVRPSKATGAHK